MPDAETRIHAIPLWDGPVTWRPLQGGLSNESFIVTDAAGEYVVRLDPKRGTLPLRIEIRKQTGDISDGTIITGTNAVLSGAPSMDDINLNLTVAIL